MKQFLTLNLKFLTLIILAYQGLKIFFDPAVEGNPYIKEEEELRFSSKLALGDVY